MELAYGSDVYEEGIKGMTEDDLLEAAGNVTLGVPIATPVFDGAKEADVNDALVRAGFSQSGQSILFDGRTGEQFARPVAGKDVQMSRRAGMRASGVRIALLKIPWMVFSTDC